MLSTDNSPTIQEAAAEYTRWRKHPQSYVSWFVEVRPSDDETALVVTYRPRWISPAELACASYGPFMGFQIIMRPVLAEAAPELRGMHGRKCPSCGYPCVRCHGKE